MLSQRPWRIEGVFLLIAVALVCLCLGVVTVGMLRQLGVPAFHAPDGFASVLVATLSFQGVTWVLMFIFLKLHGEDWRHALGLRNADWPRSLALAAGLLVVVFPLVLGLQALSVKALLYFGWTPEAEPAVELLLNSHSPWLRGYLALFAVVIAPVAEEFLFRGVLFPFIKQRGWPKTAWIGVSLLFAFIHLNAPTFVPLFGLALVLTWVYDRTDCLLASIAMHSLFNAANLVIFFWQYQ